MTASIPPLVHSAEDPHHLMWHPELDELWLWAPKAPAIWRIARDGTGTRLFDRDSLGVPDDYQDCVHYCHATGLYFDTARGAPVWLVATYADRGGAGGLLLGALDGAAFRLVPQDNGIRMAGSDGFVFDPARGVLAHFAGTSDISVPIEQERRARGGLTVRELGPDDVWRDRDPVGVAETGRTVLAGWDARLECAVYIDGDGGTHGWDATGWRELPRYPDTPVHPYYAGLSPDSGALVVVQREWGSGDTGAWCHELGADGWQRRDTGGLTEFGGLARDPGRRECWVYAPWFGSGSVQHTLGRYDGTSITAAGVPVPVVGTGTVTGPARFLGTRQRRGFGKTPLPPLLFERDGDALVRRGQAPPGIAHLVTAAGQFTVTGTGELFADGNLLAEAPEDFTARRETTAGSDGGSRLLVVGGETQYGDKRLTDVWLYDGGWSRLRPTGRAPLVTGAAVGYDPARGVWLVVGGQNRQFQPVNRTSEGDGRRWREHRSRFSDEEKHEDTTRHHILLVAVDPVTGQVFCVRHRHRTNRLYTYAGEGVWQFVGDLDAPHATAFAWEPERRILVAAGNAELTEVAIGRLLDGSGAVAGGAVARSAEPPLPAQVWLRLQQGDDDQYWFATRNAETWTESWGKRGQPPETATHTGPAGYAEAVAAKLGEGYEHAAERDAAARRPGRMSYRMRYAQPGPEAPAGDLLGGTPPGVSQQDWPVCSQCDRAMLHAATLHADPERLPLRDHVAISLFVCENPDGLCEAWDPDLGANAALLITAAAAAARPADPAPATVVPPERIWYEPVFEPDPDANDNVDDPPAVGKVGGYPGWLQGDDTPNCADCQQEMRFVAQIPEVNEALRLFGGEWFLFCCPDEHTTALLAQR